jgi:hypothetical protein
MYYTHACTREHAQRIGTRKAELVKKNASQYNAVELPQALPENCRRKQTTVGKRKNIKGHDESDHQRITGKDLEALQMANIVLNAITKKRLSSSVQVCIIVIRQTNTACISCFVSFWLQSYDAGDPTRQVPTCWTATSCVRVSRIKQPVIGRVSSLSCIKQGIMIPCCLCGNQCCHCHEGWAVDTMCAHQMSLPA